MFRLQKLICYSTGSSDRVIARHAGSLITNKLSGRWRPLSLNGRCALLFWNFKWILLLKFWWKFLCILRGLMYTYVGIWTYNHRVFWNIWHCLRRRKLRQWKRCSPLLGISHILEVGTGVNVFCALYIQGLHNFRVLVLQLASIWLFHWQKPFLNCCIRSQWCWSIVPRTP